ncbi:MAG: sigma-54-dependent Fis family transcriptional regulator [Polyangiaceae bacterium]|nr:sigma-54-dependent Fis family transcriptional regulator [Myxococcales bacterium]MCB9586074.1 sigma-54-dependent Fis family transcriptional regulator [Polyangiaceae bacterium]MCB9608909.1 sigma-54-dependent Fis family transcriptional regulator [Polyangiaceae bacterium]
MASSERFSGQPGPDTLSELGGDLETLKSNEFESRTSVSSSVETLYVRILYHTDVRRWGEVARLGGLSPNQRFELSRTLPIFRRGNIVSGAPLAEPHVSRSPVLVTTGTDGIRINASAGLAAHADGEPLESASASFEELRAHGFELQLGRRVRLRIGIQREYRGPDLGLTGGSTPLNELRWAIGRVADLQVPVLIRGETGVGKERVAQGIHSASTRADAPCVSFNMALSTRDTAASELFGHVRGAFTGALQARSGLFERAHTGTLFLDEIGELSFDVQAMLLRVLENGVFTPLGGSAERAADVRLLSATDADLGRLVELGHFRAALYHRLAGFVISVPSLRTRSEDIPELALDFLRQELVRVGESDRLGRWEPRASPWFPPQLMRDLLRHHWSGNVRELGNVVRQLCVSNRGSAVYSADATLQALLALPVTPLPRAERTEAKEIADDELVAALRAHQFSVGPTAAALGVPRSTLYGLMERSNSVRKATDLTEQELRKGLEEHQGNQTSLAAQLEISERALRLRLRALGLLD